MTLKLSRCERARCAKSLATPMCRRSAPASTRRPPERHILGRIFACAAARKVGQPFDSRTVEVPSPPTAGAGLGVAAGGRGAAIALGAAGDDAVGATLTEVAALAGAAAVIDDAGRDGDGARPVRSVLAAG